MTPISPNFNVKPRYLPTQIANQLQKSIVDEQFEVGERLPSERELATSIGVSRTVIREAMVLLQERGLVSVQSGSGVYVTAMEPSALTRQIGIFAQRQQVSIAHLYEVRWNLEIQNAQLAALRATDEAIQKLQESIDKSKQQLGHPAEFSLLDVEFHKQLAIASGNPVMLLLLETITDVLQTQCKLTEHLPGAQSNALKHHLNVLSAVRDHDVPAAAEAMATHLRNAWEWLLRAIENSESEIGEMAFVD